MAQLEPQQTIKITEGVDNTKRRFEVGDYDISYWIPADAGYTITSDPFGYPTVTITLTASSIQVSR